MNKIKILIFTITTIILVGCGGGGGSQSTPTTPTTPTEITNPEPVEVSPIIPMKEDKVYEMEKGQKLEGDNALIRVVTFEDDKSIEVELVSGVCNIDSTDVIDDNVSDVNDGDADINDYTIINTNVGEYYNINQSDIIIANGTTEVNFMTGNDGMFSTIKIINGDVQIYREKSANTDNDEKELVIN